MRIVRKVPDLLDHFAERTRSLLQDKNHGVLLCAVTLAIELVRVDTTDENLEELRKCVPLLVRHLKALVTTGYSPEHDVSGITDPFLQVKILRLLRILGKGNQAVSESMNDILAQVATNTESSKNVGNSILYETVLTILEIEAENGLRVMAINILGKFLSNRDNNIRYVALNTLNKVVTMDTNAVQRHRTIILDCLRDGDISIRRRALELSYALINESNVRVLTRELLSFLEVADNEFKLGMTTQICLAAERFAPNKRWHIDTVLRVLKLAGNYVREEVLSSFIRLVCHTPELQAYTVQKLFSAVHEDFSQESLTLAAVWVVGEFGEILLQGGNFENAESVREVKPKDIVDLLDSVLTSPYVNVNIRQYTLTSLAKLTTRISGDQTQIQRIQQILHRFDSTVEIEIQQRAVELGALLQRSDIREGVLESMPLPEVKTTIVGTVSENKPVGSTKVSKNDLLDLMGDEMGNGSGGANGDVSSATAGASTQQSAQDLLADIFGGDSGLGSSAAPAATKPSAAPRATVDDIMGLFGSTAPAAAAAAPAAQPPKSTPSAFGGGLDGLDLLGGGGGSSAPVVPAAAPPAQRNTSAAPSSSASPSGTAYTAYDSRGLKITLTPQVSPSRADVVNIVAKFYATESISDIKFQAAVPKVRSMLTQTPVLSADSKLFPTEPKIANVSHFKSEHRSWRDGYATDARHGASRGE